MSTSERAFAFLDLSLHEKSVLAAIQDTRLSTADITAKTKLPRPSIVYVLQKLYKRGLIRKVPIGKRTYWKRISADVVRRRIREVEDMLLRTVDESQEQIPHAFLLVNKNSDITVIHGIDKLSDTYIYAYTNFGQQRVLLTQFAAALQTFLKDTKHTEHLAEINRAASKVKSIVELIASEETIQLWETMAQNSSLSTAISERVVDASLVPHDLAPADLPAELCVFGDMAMLTDWETETGIIIRNEHFVRMFKILFRATKTHGESFNPNTIFLEKLQERAKRS